MAFPTGNRVLPGYPTQLGDKLLYVFDHTGPASYTSFVPGTGAGGDVLFAQIGGLNFGGIDFMDDSVDSTGQIQMFPVVYLGGYANAVPKITFVYYSLVTASLGGQSQTAGTQIVATSNLSTFSWRCRALGV
jgi:hypothetical protein